MWLGLEHMRQLLNVGGRLYTARIAVHFIGDDRVYDGYLDGVHIASEEDDYRITYSNFRTDGLNNLPDAFSETGRGINGQPFCTPDRDCGECAKDSNSGWWFSTSCAGVNINLPASKLVWPINGEPAAIAKVTVDIFPLD